jgi:hypothetical protein
MTAEDVLAKAADLIEQDGWCQGIWQGKHGERCLHEALMRAGFHQDWQAYQEAKEAVYKEVAPLPPMAYNDTSGRTVEEVVTTLRNAKRWL